MNLKLSHLGLRAEHALLGGLIVLLTAGSAVVGAAAAYRPHTDQIHAERPKPAVAAAKAAAAVPVPNEIKLSVRNGAEQLIRAKLLAEHRCLAEVMYYEARGEGVKGEKAVAEVIFHRMRAGNYGNSICAVVYEGANQPGCQFSFTCNGELAEKKSSKAWMQAQVLAARILTGEERLGNETLGAVSFHSTDVAPDWANDLVQTVQIGNHVFYRHPAHSRPM